MARRPSPRPFVPIAALLLLQGCDLTEAALAPEVDALVVEATVRWYATGETRALVWVHRALGPTSQAPVEVTVELGLASGQTVLLPRASGPSRCVAEAPADVGGVCLEASGGPLESVNPGDSLILTVRGGRGEVLEGRTVLPGLHTLVGIADGGQCSLPPSTPLPIRWSVSDGAWAYLNETLIRGLPAALEPRGIPVEDDPLPLLGLSISAQDTTVVFPSEFGLFQRADLDQGLAVALQDGLPPGTEADVTIAAVDRNLVNWLRGGRFNPSGQVRVPSVTGDGTGFFGAAVVRGFRVLSSSEPSEEAPACPLDG